MPAILLVALLIAQTQSPHSVDRDTKTVETCTDPLAYQVLLDRLGLSPGEIDGRAGPNLRRATEAFQARARLQASGTPDCASWEALRSGGGADILTDYELTEQDVRGPYLERPLPGDLTKQATLPALAYSSLAEAIAERFHASPKLIERLNKGRTLQAGTALRVPAVTPFDPTVKPNADAAAPSISIEVSRRGSTLRALRPDGTVAFFAPVSSGSEHDPLPIGEWKVTGTAWMPPFDFNPDLFWDAEAGDSKAVIKPGPNNPVGVVWVDINVPHYGMHGTPTPNLVGHAQSHGCVRLTNWDAARLASLVRPGTHVEFLE